jgi:tRNA A37 threonylcarbamoyladenosine synthetase subunit TsaC/SUA5/YrdC
MAHRSKARPDTAGGWLRSSPSDLSNATTKPLVSSTLLLPGQEEPITRGWEITRELGHTVEAVIDSGDCGTEPTTVIDFSQPEPEIVRRGVGGRV